MYNTNSSTNVDNNNLLQVPPLSPPSDTSIHLHFKPTPTITTSLLSAKTSPQIKHSPPPSPLLKDASTIDKKMLSKPDLKKTTQILSSLQKHTSSWPFLRPVDPTVDPAPNYLEIVKNPMDLSTIARKLKEGRYEEVEEFIRDVRLMFANCAIYNPKGHLVNDEGRVLERHFGTLLGNFYPEIDVEFKEQIEQRIGESKRRKSKSNQKVALEESTTTEEEDDTFVQDSSSSEEEFVQTSKYIKKKTPTNTYYYKRKLLLQSQNPTPLPKPKKATHKSNRTCTYCGTNETPMWRRGPSGTGTLCNKCGVKWRNGRILEGVPPPRQRQRQSKPKPKKKEQIVIIKPLTLSPNQKQSLSQKINTLPLSKLRRVIAIIQDERAFGKLRGADEEEKDVELDLNALSSGCCFKLWEFVMGEDEDSDDE